jgi:hypothetical protein
LASSELSSWMASPRALSASLSHGHMPHLGMLQHRIVRGSDSTQPANSRALPVCTGVCSESPQTGSPDDRPPTANKGALARTPSTIFTSTRTRSRPVAPLTPPIPRAPNSQRIAVWLESLALRLVLLLRRLNVLPPTPAVCAAPPGSLDRLCRGCSRSSVRTCAHLSFSFSPPFLFLPPSSSRSLTLRYQVASLPTTPCSTTRAPAAFVIIAAWLCVRALIISTFLFKKKRETCTLSSLTRAVTSCYPRHTLASFLCAK